MDGEKYIIDSITKMSGRHTPYKIFSDWITISAVAIQNCCKMMDDDVYKEREKLYLDIAGRYTKDELKNMADMTGALAMELEQRFGDILGEIYMKSGCGSKITGQFFTPYHISLMTAEILYANQFDHLNENDVIEINEPSVGSGGMIIAVANVMKEHAINYQKQMRVTAQDLDWNGVYMTYVQLSMLGIKAVVVQGNSLAESYKPEYDRTRVFRTPAEMGVLL